MIRLEQGFSSSFHIDTLILLPYCIINRAVNEINGHMEAAARELSLERFENFENELFQVGET